jgi:hypothetical protein
LAGRDCTRVGQEKLTRGLPVNLCTRIPEGSQHLGFRFIVVRFEYRPKPFCDIGRVRLKGGAHHISLVVLHRLLPLILTALGRRQLKEIHVFARAPD